MLSPQEGIPMLRAALFLCLTSLSLPAVGESTNFESVLVNKNVTRNGERGLEIQSRFIVEGLKGKSLDLSVYFYNTDRSKLKDLDGTFASPDGQVATSVKFEVEGDNIVYDTREPAAYPLALFIPYKQLHLSQGDFFLRLQMQLFLHGTNQAVGTSNFASVALREDDYR